MKKIQVFFINLLCILGILVIYSASNDKNHLSINVAEDGSANYSIPIRVPSGINTLKPNISIHYNSNIPNSILGVGFQLQGLPIIKRVNNGKGINYNSSDTFLSPSGRLILVDTENSIYHSENENWLEYVPYLEDGALWKANVVTNQCGGGPCYWKVYSSNGEYLEFGKGSSRIYKSGSSGVIKTWSISKRSDVHNNHYTVTYVQEDGAYYPIEVKQFFNPTQEFYKIIFLRESRTDIEESYAESAKVKVHKRLKEIQVITGSNLIRKYTISYGYSPTSYKSRISQIQECVSDGSCLEPTVFTWTGGSLNSNFTTTTISNIWTYVGVSNPSHALFDISRLKYGDFNGDGKTDIYVVEGWGGNSNDYDNLYYSKGDGFFLHHRTNINSYFSNSEAWGFVDIARFGGPVDLNGDGKDDFFCIHGWNNSKNSIVNLSLTGGRDYLTSITSPIGLKADINYKLAKDFSNSIGNNLGNCDSGGSKGQNGTCGIPNASIRHLVQSVQITEPSSSHTYTTTYSYKDARIYTNGTLDKRVSLGFSEIRTNHPNGTYTIKKYYQEKHIAGQLKEQLVYTNKGVLISKLENPRESINQYQCNRLGCTQDNSIHLNQPKQVLIGKTIQYQYNTNSNLLLKTTITNTYDTYGRLTKSIQFADVTNSSTADKTIYTVNKYVTHYTSSTGGLRGLNLAYSSISCVGDGSSSNCMNTDTTLNKTRISYDGKIYNTPIESNDKMQITKEENWLGNTSGSDIWGSTLTTYNTNGTIKTQTDGTTGNEKSYTYDSTYPHITTSITTASGGNNFTSGNNSYTQAFSNIDTTYLTPKRSTDRNGLVKNITLDPFGRIKQVTYEDTSIVVMKQTKSYVVNTTERSVTECNYYGTNLSEKNCLKIYEDSLQREIKSIETGIDGHTKKDVIREIEYDSYGREWKIYKSYFSDESKSLYTKKQYDNFGRLSIVTIPNGSKTLYKYDDVTLVSGASRVTSVTSSDGIIKRTYVNLDGKDIRVTQAAGTSKQTTINYSYYVNGLLKSITSPQGITKVTYTNLYQQASLTDPNAGTTYYTYYETLNHPSFGQIKTEQRPDANAIETSSTITSTKEYKASFGRISREYYGDEGSPQIDNQFTYDETAINYSGGLLTKLVSTASDYTIKKTFSYDILGRTLSEVKKISHTSLTLCSDSEDLPCTSMTSWTYDNLNRLTSTTYPNGKVIYNDYLEGSSLVDKIKDSTTDYATYSNYNVYAQTGRVNYANGIYTTYTYGDKLSLLSNLKTIDSNSTTTLLNYTYRFDTSGRNISQITDSILSDLTSTYTYDKLNRIESVQRGNNHHFNYSFDSNGNLSQSQGNLVIKDELIRRKLCYQAGCSGSSTANKTTKIHHERVYDSVSNDYITNNDTYTFSWSTAGNLLSKTNITHGTFSYTYDAQNMLRTSQTPDGKTTTHYYDETGQRFLKVYTHEGEKVHTYYLSPHFEYRERIASGSKTSQNTTYVMGVDGKRIASITKGSYLTAQIKSNQYSRMAGMFNPNYIKGSYLKLKYLFLSFYHTSDFGVHVWLLLLILCTFFMFSFSIYCYKRYHNTFNLGHSLVASFMVLMILSAFNCTSKNNSFQEGLNIDYSLLGDTSIEDCTGTWNKIYDVTEGSSAGVTRKFTDQEYDPESGLYYYNARYYDSSIGVFTTADNIIPSAEDSQSYNRHMYVTGNPIIYIDPTGNKGCHFFTSCFWKKAWKTIVAAFVLIASVVLAAFTAGFGAALGGILGGVATAGASWSVATLANQTDNNPKNDNDVNIQVGFTGTFDFGGGSGNSSSSSRDSSTSLVGPNDCGSIFCIRLDGRHRYDSYNDTTRAGKTHFLDNFQNSLSAAGLIPGVGIIADITNSAVSAIRGNWTDAAINAAAAVPILGHVAGASRLASKASLYKNITQSSKSARNIKTDVSPFSFALSLRKSGFQYIGKSDDGVVRFYRKGNLQYQIRGVSKEGSPTVDLYRIHNKSEESKKLKLKIRLGR